MKLKPYQIVDYARTDRNAILDVTGGDEIGDKQMRDVRQQIAEALGIERSGVRVGGTLHYVLELHDWVDGLPERIERAITAAAQWREAGEPYQSSLRLIDEKVNAGIEALNKEA